MSWPSQAPVAKSIPGNRMVVFGDSITNFGGFGQTATATAVGKIATVNYTNHGEVVGNPYPIVLQLSANNVTAYHGVWKVATVIDKDNFTVVLNETPSGPAGNISFVNSRSLTSGCYWEAMNFKLNGAFNFVANAGIGSNTTDLMLARIYSDVIAYKPDFCINLGGTNDIRYTQTLAAKNAAVANLKTICKIELAAGITPILVSILPVGAADQGFAIVTPLIMAANAELAAWAAQNVGVIWVDAFSVLVDRAASDNRAIQSCLTDTVHLNYLGAYKVGSALADAVRKYNPNAPYLISSNFATYGYSNTLKNRLSNPLFLISGGTLGAGVTSAGGAQTGIAQQWTATVGGTATAVVSLVPRTIADDGDTVGNNQHCVVTGVGLDDSFVLKTTQTLTQFTAGDDVYYEFSFAVRSATNLKFFIIDLAVTLGGQTYHQYIDAGSGGGFPSADAPFIGVKRSLYFRLPTGSITGVVLSVQPQFLGAGSVTFDVARATIGTRISA